jgi:hypothetical protein
MENLARWAWALFVPGLLMALLIVALPERGLEGIIWLVLAVAVLIGALAFVSSEWRPLTKVLVTVAYIPLMGIIVLISSVFTACSVHGCH